MRASVLVLATGSFAAWPDAAAAQWGSPPPQQQQRPYGSPQYGSPQYGSQNPPGGLESGGLAPPPPMSEDPDSARTEERLERAEEEDSGRGLEFFYLNAEVGFEHLGLQTFSANRLVDAGVVDTTQTGLLFGAGLGLRLVFITIGPRFRLASFSEYQVWTLNAELGLRIPLGSIEPYLTFGGGYASLGSFDAGNLGGVSADNVDVTGYDIRIGGGLDVYVTPVFSIGASLTGEVLGLTRPGVDPSKIQAAAGGNGSGASAAEVYAADGSSLGFGVTGTAVAGLHF